VPALLGAEPLKMNFDLPADAAEQALKRFAVQSGLEVLFVTETVAKVKTNAVKGEFSPREAINRMLAGTNLVASEDANSGAMKISRAPKPNSRTSTQATPGDSPSNSLKKNEIQTPQTQEPMKRTKLVTRLAAALALFAAPAVPGNGQTAPAGPPPGQNDDVIELTPFEVTASAEMGYEARDTLAGGRLKTELKDVPSQVQVMTSEFMKDLAITDLADALAYSLNVEGSPEFFNHSTPNVAGNEDSIQVFSGAPRTRGINGTTIGRDFFQTVIPVDGYNMERLTFAPGANNALFGNSTPAGAIDTTTKRALIHRRSFSVSARFDDLGSERYVWDFNQPIKKIAAVRYVGMRERRNDFRKPSWRDQDRNFLAGTFTPERRISIRGWYEDYKSKAQPVKNTLVRDRASAWFEAGQPAFDNSIWATAPTGIRASIPGATPDRPFARVSSGTNNYVYVMDGSGGLGMVKLNQTVRTVGQAALGTAPDRFDYSVIDENIVPTDIAISGNGIRNRQIGRNYGAVVNANPVKDLFLEAGVNYEIFKHRAMDLMRNSELVLYADANMWAVDTEGNLMRNSDGSFVPNPNFGRRFIDSTFNRGATGLRDTDQQRISAAYQLDFTDRNNWMKWLGRYNLAGIYDRVRQRTTGTTISDFRIVSDLPGVPHPSTTLNPTSLAAPAGPQGAAVSGSNPRDPMFRYYLPDAQHPGSLAMNLPFDVLASGLITLPNSAIPGGAPAAQLAAFDSPYGSTHGDWPNLRIGHSRTFSGQAYLWKDRVVLNYTRRSDVVRNGDADGVVPYPRINAGFAYVENVYDDIGFGDYAEVYGARRSSSNHGIVVHPLRWLSAHYAGLENTQITGLTRLNLDGTFAELGTGRGKEYGVTFRIKDRFQIRLNKYETLQIGTTNSVLVNTGLPTAPGGGFGNQIRDDIHNLERGALHAGAPTSDTFAEWHNWLRSIPDTGNAASANVPGFGTARTVYDFIVDRRSTGYEVTATGNLTRNWRASISGSQGKSVEWNIGKQYFDLIRERLPVWGQYLTARTGVSNQTIGQLLPFAVDNFYYIDTATGVTNVADRKYRVNATTSYSFRDGLLRGARIGGSYSWRSPAAIGYRSKTLSENPYATLAGLPAREVVVPDINNPIRGGALISLDAFASYGRRLFNDKVRWEVQLNVRNVMDRTKLIPQRAISTGQVVNFAAQAPRTFILTNTFSF
jgi:outer membrane receptor protein involved in Fe transport